MVKAFLHLAEFFSRFICDFSFLSKLSNAEDGSIYESCILYFCLLKPALRVKECGFAL